MSDSSGEQTAAWENQESFAIVYAYFHKLEHGTYHVNTSLMGPTGTGKSTFVNLVTQSDLCVGNELESCTDSVHFTSPIEVDGKQIILLDTPGFDDTKIADSDVLKMIAASLSLLRGNKIKLAGVIYMHRIVDNRIGGISNRNFRMFRHLCGDSSLSNVVIVTTMWDQIEENRGKVREFELKTKSIFFEPAITRGARIARHDNTYKSALSIVRSILSHESCHGALQIQTELESGIGIHETKAGQELGKDLREQSLRHENELREVMEEMRQAIQLRDEASRKELALEREKLEEMVKRLEQESASLVAGYTEVLTRLEAKMQSSLRPVPVRPSFSAVSAPLVAAAETESNAILEGKIAAAFPIFGFWGRLAVMLAPFSLSWK